MNQTRQKGQGNAGGWPSTTNNPSGRNRSNNPSGASKSGGPKGVGPKGSKK